MGAMKKIIAKRLSKRQSKEVKRANALIRQFGKVCVKCDKRFKFTEKWSVCEGCR